MSPCQVVWVVHEARNRLVLPFVSQLRRLGYPSDLLWLEEAGDPAEHFLRLLRGDVHTLVAFYSYEDFLYAKDVWSWETQERKPDPRVTSAEDVEAFQHDHTSFCCIHDENNDDKIRMHADLMHCLKRLTVVPDEAALVAFVQENFPHSLHLEAPPLTPPPPPLPLPLVPLAKRVVIIRHAQRLDEVHERWSSLASRPQDSPLSVLGVKQSRYLGQWLGKQAWMTEDNLGGVYVSPFVRTVQTAHFALEEVDRAHTFVQGKEIKATSDDIDDALDENGIGMKIEYGLAEGAAWMAQSKNNRGMCQTPWHLSGADLYGISHRIDLDYESLKIPQFTPGSSYPGRPVELDAWYDRCAQAVWRLSRLPQHEEKTLILVTHGGCVDNIVHALSGHHLDGMPTHTCVTSLLRDSEHGNYALERVSQEKLEHPDANVDNSCSESEFVDIKLSQHHLPTECRTGTAV